MKKILIDVNSIVMRRGYSHLPGIGRTTLDLLTALSKIKSLPFEVQLYFQGSDWKALERYQLEFPILYFPLPGSGKYLNWATKLRLKEVFSNYDLLHIPHNYAQVNNPEKTLVTIHDAMFFSYPEKFLKHDFAKENYPRLAKTCKAIVTCSHSSKRDIVTYMQVPEEKVTVVHWGVSKDVFFPESQKVIDEIRQKENLKRPYFIMVSCDIGRKNTISLLRAFREYVREGGKYDLVLIWGNPPSVYFEEFSDLVAKRRVFFVKHVSDPELRALYSGAIASFFPSKYEGFGLPILESMACGTPVVTCENSSLKEVGGNLAYYTDPDDLKRMTDYMFNFEQGKYDLLQLREALLAYTDHFTWEKTALGYVDFYKAALGI